MLNLSSIIQIQSGLCVCVCLFADMIKMDDARLNSICSFHPFLLEERAISLPQPVTRGRTTPHVVHLYLRSDMKRTGNSPAICSFKCISECP